MNQNYKKGGFLTTLFLVFLLGVMFYSGYQLMKQQGFLAANEVAPTRYHTQTIVRNDTSYFPRQDIRVIMVLGIDQSGPVVSSASYRNPGSADSIILLIFDETNQTCTPLYLNRDTMLNMDVLGIRGEYAGTTYGQVALSHTYGSGMEDSCENVKNTLMKFLPGMTIDYYVSMNMDAIAILNDAVGGVTVEVTDDFSAVDPSIHKGIVHLTGNQVITYVRTRKDVGDQKNQTRMQRQKQYVNGFMRQLREKMSQESEFLLKAYEDVSPYIVTDCSANTLSGMLNRYLDYTITETISPEGNNVIGTQREGKFYQFYTDEEKLDDLIIRLFYAPK